MLKGISCRAVLTCRLARSPRLPLAASSLSKKCRRRWWALSSSRNSRSSSPPNCPGAPIPIAVSDVRPQVNGIIQHRLFTEGSTVKAGQPLYQIDPAPYQAAYDSAAATLASAKVKAERYAALLKANAIAPQDNDDAQAAYLQAKANVETARINLDYTRIIAPISGRIGASSVTEGALVTASQTNALATISTLDPIYVDINQSSSELLALRRAAAGGQIDRAARYGRCDAEAG